VGKSFEGIDEALRTWLLEQPVFFVATAPSGSAGHINVSPKGLEGTFTVVDDHHVAYLDLTGSGIETVAHLRENGRIVLMFCAFSGPPRIVRLHGQGRPAGPETWPTTPPPVGARTVINVEVTRIADSCGFGVPLMDFAGQRPTLVQWAARKTADGIVDYQAVHNAESIDGLPGLAGL